MFARSSIRLKLMFGVTMLALIVSILSIGGLTGVLAYRRLARSVSERAAELPKAASLTQSVNNLRVALGQIRATQEVLGYQNKYDSFAVRQRFMLDLIDVEADARSYKDQLRSVEAHGSGLISNEDEWETVRAIDRQLQQIAKLSAEKDWALNQVQTDLLEIELDQLHKLAEALPSYLQVRMQDLKDNARGEYHALIALTSTTAILAVVSLFLLVRSFKVWVFSPLGALIRGSRRVAAGDFDHRIDVRAHDEMSELAAAMNDMTKRFREIRDDLDQQVKQRTTEVVRSEQLASVGFLAAGVAHEINNPLASIAWCAESLDQRLHHILYDDEECESHELGEDEIEVLRKYLGRIQEEAFRCKGITEGLLDFSRLGDVRKHHTDLREVVSDVIEMLKHLGRYRNKRIEFNCSQAVVAWVNAQEMKQVALNLITNALDSVDTDGVVRVGLSCSAEQAHLIVEDSGCGMTDEILKHLFEPFFTRRRDGQGTGLGLSITYRIVSEHGGTIEPSSPGPGRGSRFLVTLPLVDHEKKQQKQKDAA